MEDLFEVAVIGAGPGGYVAAIRCAQLGLKTCIIEKDSKLGGTCLHRGCIPTKAWLHDSQLFHKMTQADKFGIVVEGSIKMDIAKLLKRKNDILNKMAMGIDGLMKKNRIQMFTGKAQLTSPTSIEVVGPEKTQTVQAKNIILATGSQPARIPGLEIDGVRTFTSDEILNLDRIPDSLIVLGAGAVGMEFASIYHKLGAQVQVVEMMNRVLPFEDEEISGEIRKSYEKQGIKIHTGVKMERCAIEENGVRVELSFEGGGASLEADIFLMAAGRRPVTEGLGLEALGIQMQGRFVATNPYLQTNIPNIYAIGDITPSQQLAHVASAEGIVAAEHIAGHNPPPLDYGKIPSATYCSPEVASVGLSEKAASEKGYDVKVGRFPWLALGKASILGETEGLVKVVADAKYGELLGVHIVGPHATDLIAEACVAMQCEATVEELFRTVHAHPTLSEAVMEAAHGVFHNPIHFVPPPPRKPKENK